jgi:nucleoside-diphosphate-sugar epimerase
MWLLIGGSGFVGTNFAKFLNENDYSFKIYDKHRSKYLPNGVETIIGDARDLNKLSQSMEGCEVVFHLATAPPSLRIPKREVYDIDVNGTQNVLMAAEENNVKRVVFASSASHVYGPVDKTLCPIKEDCNLNPINEYGENKVIAEELCKIASETRDLQAVVLRLSMVLGPYNFDPILLENILPLLRNKRVVIAGDGESKGQSIHVEDVNTALLASAELPDKKLPEDIVFNISGDEVLTLNEFMSLSKSICGSTSKAMYLPLPLAGVMAHIAWKLDKTKIHPSYIRLMAQDQFFDIRKAKHILGWKPKHTVEDAIKDTVEFLKEEYL